MFSKTLPHISFPAAFLFNCYELFINSNIKEGFERKFALAFIVYFAYNVVEQR